MKLKFHVPTQQYGFLEIEGTEKNLKEMEALYNEYAESPLSFKKGVYKKVSTYTGEEVLYNEETHSYTDLDGNKATHGEEVWRSGIYYR